MNFNFELILFYATVITGLISLFDIIFLAPKRKTVQPDVSKQKLPVIIDWSRSFFPVLLIVFLLRSFLFEPFRIPSGSLEPSLLVGDFILVNKFDYGTRLPVVHTKLFGSGTPQRGDIIVFRWPPNPSVDFIKRVIGVPGDHISYINKELYVNGQKIPQEFVLKTHYKEPNEEEFEAVENQEDLLGVKHKIYLNPARTTRDYHDIVVPAGMYFAMGDNRDASADSRYWGFVPDKNIVGKAVLVWMSWDSKQTWYNPFASIRFNRIGKLIS